MFLVSGELLFYVLVCICYPKVKNNKNTLKNCPVSGLKCKKLRNQDSLLTRSRKPKKKKTTRIFLKIIRKVRLQDKPLFPQMDRQADVENHRLVEEKSISRKLYENQTKETRTITDKLLEISVYTFES